MTIATIINGGLPVLASSIVQRAEPDVGIMCDYVEDIEITFMSGHPFRGEISASDCERIAAEIAEVWAEWEP